MFSRSIHSIVTTVILGTFLLVTGCGGSSSSGSGAVSFPTPTLPANAVIIDTNNATDIANTAVDFLFIFASYTNYLKTELPQTETPPSIREIIKLVANHLTRRDRRSSPVVKGVTDDLSAFFCFSGTAIATYTETSTGEIGTLIFTNCDFGGVLVSGSQPYDFYWDNNSDNYDFHTGGTLTFDFGTDIFTVVWNMIITGDDVTFDYTHSITYSLVGLPGSGFLVSTPQTWVGNAFFIEVYSGQLIVTGGGNTRLRITVTATNVAEVELDDGSGTFVLWTTIPIIV